MAVTRNSDSTVKQTGAIADQDGMVYTVGYNGNDLDDTTSPIEAGLGWITKFVEGKNFINRPMLEKQKTEGTVRKLVGFEMIDRGIPRHGYELQSMEGAPIGVVTSGTMSPTRKVGIGMGYVKPEYSKIGTEIFIDMRGRKLKAVVVKPPFRKG